MPSVYSELILGHALNSLAVVAPDWLRDQVAPEWFDRYGPRMDTYHLPKTAAARDTVAAPIGTDGRRLLQAVEAASELPWLREIPAVQVLRQVWAEPYTNLPGPLRWRAVQELASSAELMASPYDPEARYSTKRGVTGVGSKVHLTETCDADSPHLITHVRATPATTPDSAIGPTIQHGLARRDLLPSIHVFDSGYVDAELFVTAQMTHQIEVLGPAFGSYSRQRRAGQGYDLSAFVLDGEAQQARCPQGQPSVKWTPGRDRSGDPVVRIRFDTATCRACPGRRACTWAQEAPRQLTARPQVHHEAIQAARRRQATQALWRQYATRAGIEGTHTQAIRRCGLRRCRYVGQAKAHVQPVITAAAIDMVRVAAWLAGTPRATTRQSAFAALAA